ncbi:MAG TPA: ATP-binding protein, partial [Myxococcota bacterium]|nr:ATP-binding protein [Myxococcota bacterium]
SHVLRQRDREFARHLLGPFLAQLQTLEAIPHGALLLRDGDALNGVANARARQILRDAGQHDEQVEVVRQMAAESTAAGIPAWVPVDGMGVLVWRPAGTASDLLLFSPLDGMLALDRALTIDRLTSTSFLHHLRTLVKVTHTGVRGLHDLLTHGATSTIGEALSIWPPRLPDSAVLIERLLRGDRAPSAVSAVRRWRDLGFDHVGHHVEELVAAACEPGEGFSDAEARLMGAVEGSARPPLIADALLRLAQLAHYQRSLEATLRPLEANSRLLDPRAGPVRDRTLHFLAEDLADMGRVMAALERPAIEVTFDPVDAPGDRALPDARLIEHAVLNLMSNAIHAVAKVGGGHVRVSMKERGAHLMIEVHDDGAPLPPAIAAAPYLPPSADAEARGWGLHLTYAIAKRAGGHMPPPALGAVEGDPARQPKSFRLVLPFAGGAGHA